MFDSAARVNADSDALQTCVPDHTGTSTESCLAPFCNSTVFSDLVLKAEDTEIHAHRVLIAASSPSLAAMLQVSSSCLVLTMQTLCRSTS